MPHRTVANDLGDVALAVHWADQRLEEVAVSKDLRADIQVCLEEALANLILHGQCNDSDKAILVSLDVRDDSAAIVICDRCEPFDAARVPLLPDLTRQDKGPGGHGLLLMQGLSTHLSYRTENGVNKLEMIFKLAGLQPQPGTLPTAKT